MRQRLFMAALGIITLSACAPLLMGQAETGQITGTVFDPTGAVIPQATVMLKSVDTGLAKLETTNASGIYVFPSLLVGPYQLNVTAAGFSSMAQKIVLTVGAKIGLDFCLEVGRAETVVEDKGDAFYDVRQRFTTAGFWSVPYKGRTAFTKYLLGGGSLAPIFTAQTGMPYNVTDCTMAVTFCPMAMFDAPAPKSHSGPLVSTGVPNSYIWNNLANMDSSWYNPRMGASDWGPFPSNMIGRNFFRGPGTWNLDLSVQKNFELGESQTKRLVFRAEAYNFFNHPNLTIGNYIGDDHASSTPYIPVDYSGRRFVQLALRFQF